MADDGDKRIELYLLGGIELRGINHKDADRVLAQPKLTALLAFLAPRVFAEETTQLPVVGANNKLCRPRGVTRASSRRPLKRGG